MKRLWLFFLSVWIPTWAGTFAVLLQHGWQALYVHLSVVGFFIHTVECFISKVLVICSSALLVCFRKCYNLTKTWALRRRANFFFRQLVFSACPNSNFSLVYEIPKQFYCSFTALFKNTGTLKFKSQLTFSVFRRRQSS